MPFSAEQPIRILVEAWFSAVSSDRLTSWKTSSSACFWASSPRDMRAVSLFSGSWGSSSAPDRVVTPTVGISWEIGHVSSPSVGRRDVASATAWWRPGLYSTSYSNSKRRMRQRLSRLLVQAVVVRHDCLPGTCVAVQRGKELGIPSGGEAVVHAG